MRIYIAGPMTGIADHNFPAFDRERDRLRALGHEVVSPADMSRELDASAGVASGSQVWETYMEADLIAIASCEAVYLLPGWWHSRGAVIERNRAIALGLAVMEVVRAEEVMG